MANVAFWSLLSCGLVAAVAQIELPKASNRIAIITSFFTEASTENGGAITWAGEFIRFYTNPDFASQFADRATNQSRSSAQAPL
jgi:hypothetical protein